MSFIDDVIIASLLECKSNVDELIAILPVLSSTRVIDKILLSSPCYFTKIPVLDRTHVIHIASIGGWLIMMLSSHI